MPRPRACEKCKGGDCADCLNSPENSTPVRLYTPKGAVRAMLAGKVLQDGKGNYYSWDNKTYGFLYWKKESEDFNPVEFFDGLYEVLP